MVTFSWYCYILYTNADTAHVSTIYVMCVIQNIISWDLKWHGRLTKTFFQSFKILLFCSKFIASELAKVLQYYFVNAV